MKTFLFCTTSDNKYEINCGSYLVTAESKEEAEKLFKIENTPDKRICHIEELDLSVKGQIEIQESVTE